MRLKCVWTSAVLTKGYALPGMFVGGLVAVLEDGRYLIVSDVAMQDSHIAYSEEAIGILEASGEQKLADIVKTGIIEIKLDRLTAMYADSCDICMPWKIMDDGSAELILEDSLITRFRKKEPNFPPGLPEETINLINGDSIDIYSTHDLRTIDQIAKRLLDVLDKKGYTNMKPLYQITDKTRWAISLLLGQWYAYDTVRAVNAA
jgi:hypothetical protein